MTSGLSRASSSSPAYLRIFILLFFWCSRSVRIFSCSDILCFTSLISATISTSSCKSFLAFISSSFFFLYNLESLLFSSCFSSSNSFCFTSSVPSSYNPRMFLFMSHENFLLNASSISLYDSTEFFKLPVSMLFSSLILSLFFLSVSRLSSICSLSDMSLSLLSRSLILLCIFME